MRIELEQINKLKPNKPWLAMAMDLEHFAKIEAVGRDMRPPKIRLRLKRPPMSGKASPTYIGCLRQVNLT
jgi:hypothetical protein